MDDRKSPAAIWWSRSTPKRIKRMRKHYYANITLIDDWVGKMVEAIQAKDQLDSTIFVFTSDHGDCLGDHHQVYKFSSHYDSVARVPLVFAGPGISNLGVCDPLIELIDLGPTLLDLVGLDSLEGASGISLCPLLENRGKNLHETVFSEHGPRIMARTREWKLVFYPGESYGELYHLSEDPDELYNLYDHPEAKPARANMVESLMHWYAMTSMHREF